MKTGNIVLDKSFQFALIIIKTYKNLTSEKKEFVMSKQLLRSGTAVGALIKESQNAESKKDFIHKLAIALKECDETIYWIELLFASEYLEPTIYKKLKQENEQLLKLLRSIIISTKQRLNVK